MPEEVKPAAQEPTAAAPAGTTPAPGAAPAGGTPPPTGAEATPVPAGTGTEAKPPEFTSALAAKPAGDGKEGAKPGEGKPGDPAFQVKVPEGVLADPEAVGFLEGLAREGNLSPELAQKMAEAHWASLQRYEAHQVQKGQEQIDAWEAEIKGNAEFGGVKLEKNVEAAKLLLQKYGSPKLVDDFRRMGVLSHPEFAYLLMRMSRDLSEHASFAGSAPEGAAPHNVARNLFPGFR